MKGIDLFCASQSATAIGRFTSISMDEITPAAAAASSSSSTIHLGSGRAIDRFNPIITDSRRRTGGPVPHKLPTSSPINHTDTNNTNNKNKSFENNNNNNNNNNNVKKKKKKKNYSGRKQLPLRGGDEAAETAPIQEKSRGWGWRCTKPGGFITPQSSSRYLLNDDKDYFLDFDPIFKLDDPNNNHNNQQAQQDSIELSTLSSSHPAEQVVVLRVSLHCRGCERKMRKHISRMQGVSSFNIDFLAKKVTVVGNVTPLGVLASISKVKNAQLWSPAMAANPFPTTTTTTTTTKPVVVVGANENVENVSRNIQLMSIH